MEAKPPSGKPGLFRRPNLEPVSAKPFPKAPPPGPPLATPAAAPVAAVSKGVAAKAAKAQPKQVQFQGPERPALVMEGTVQPVFDSITRSSPSPAKAKAAHSTGAKAVARVTFKGADVQSDAKGAVEGGRDCKNQNNCFTESLLLASSTVPISSFPFVFLMKLEYICCQHDCTCIIYNLIISNHI